MLQLLRGLLRPLSYRVMRNFGVAVTTSNDDALESTVLKNHLLRVRNNIEQLNIELVLQESDGRYISYFLLMHAFKSYELQATPYEIEKVCKSLLAHKVEIPEKKLLVNFVQYYERKPQELFAWKDLDQPANKLALLRLVSAMTCPPSKLISDFLKKLDFANEPMEIVVQACNTYSMINENQTDLSERIHAYSEELKDSDKLSQEQLNAIAEFFRVNFWTLFSTRTFDNMRDALEKNLPGESKTRINYFMTCFNLVPRVVLLRLREALNILERQAFRINQQESKSSNFVINKVLILLMRANFNSNYIVPDMLKNKEKYDKLRKGNIDLVNYVVEQYRRLDQDIPIAILRSRVKESLIIVERAFRVTINYMDIHFYRNKLQKSLRTLYSVRKDIPFGERRQIKELNYRHALKTEVFSQQSVKLLFLLYCELEDTNNIKILAEHLKTSIKPEDVDVLAEVWYNIKRLKLTIDLPLRITDCATKGIFAESVSKIFYCLNGEDEDKVNAFLVRIEPTIEDILRFKTLHLKTLFNVLQEYAKVPKTSKFLFVHLQSSLMREFSQKPIDLNDIKFVKKHFEMANAGSRKLHDFLNDSVRDPSTVKNNLAVYLKQEKKFIELRQKQRVDKIKVRRVQDIESKKDE